ncbi:MAG: tetratricopeptide repeat protein [Gemmatimonadetes bacterium]|nr:tetratricopeptide repeat protein [Gemmatimonadota bacterium]
MVSRHTLIYLLFFIVAGTIAVLGPRKSHSAAAAGVQHVPDAAVDALRDGRYLRASLILREYLSTRRDSTPSAILLAARAEAGWGDWERVSDLLEGRSWLSGEASGFGWSLLGRSQLELGRWREGSQSLGRYLAIAGGGETQEQGLVLLRRAEALTKDGDYAAAQAAYDAAAELLPQVDDWIQAFAASSAAGGGDTMVVRQRLTGLDPELVNEWSWRTQARARQNARDLAGAVAEAERAAERLTNDTRRAAAWTLVGKLRQERGNGTGARTAYIRAMNIAQGSSAAIEAARALSEMGGLSVEDQLLVGRVYLRHGNLQRGVAGLTAYIDAGRGSATQRAALRYDLANAQFRGGEYQAAERALLAIAASSTDTRLASDAMYTAARAQYRDGRQSVARGTLARIVSEYPDQAAAVRAAYLTADLDHDEANLAQAEEHYRQAARLSPLSEHAALAHMRLGGIAFSAGRFDEALQTFEEFRASHPTGRHHQQATYWTAQALERLGRSDEARARLAETRRLDPFSYYGGLAGEALNDDGWAARLEPAPPHNAGFDEQVERALSRVDLLREIGWEEAATFEMERVRRHFAAFDGASYALAESLNSRGFTTQGIGLGWEIYRREGAWNLRLLRIVYPFPFRNIIMAEARERGVDPFLAAALIRQESMFNARARSPVGALGLMQVMPATGRSLARRLGVSGFDEEMLTQPELNVLFGMAYLADQLRNYGRLDAVLAAYNAGPTRVTRWQRFPEYRDRLLFAERIPFDETRDYVRIVQNNRRIYAALYSDLAVEEITAPSR